MKGKGILDILQECLGLDYLSDLRTFQNKKQIAAIIELIPAEKYSLFAWKDTVKYLTGHNGEFKDEREAKQFLQSYNQ